MGETNKIWMNKIYRFIQICLQLADIADQKKETPFHDELSMGCMAFSGYMRQGVKEIIDLKQDYFFTLSRMVLAEASEKDARDFLQECFGDSEIDSINDADKERIIALCKQIEAEWEEEQHDSD